MTERNVKESSLHRRTQAVRLAAYQSRIALLGRKSIRSLHEAKLRDDSIKIRGIYHDDKEREGKG